VKRVLREALIAGGIVAFAALVVSFSDEPVVAVLTFAVAAALLPVLRRGVERLIHFSEVTPYSALADAAQRMGAPSLGESLPGLARVLADGTGARGATVWLAVGERLEAAATYPPSGDDSAENLAVLLARPGIGAVVPVLDGTELRAALSIDKPDQPVTPGDRVLLRDVAKGAALLLRTVASNAELADRVRRADRLAAELQVSRQRLAHAREVERRRLLTELSRATSGRLVALREHVTAVRSHLGDEGTGPEPAGAALVRARTEVDELIDAFRVIARGVYPAVLRSQGPGAALEELAADLRRPVRLAGDLDVRVAWEIESAVYQVTAATLDVLAGQPATEEIRVRLTHGDAKVRVLIEDPAATVTAAQVRDALVDDIERLAALGGDVAFLDDGDGDGGDGDGDGDGDGPTLRLVAWLPDRLDALLDADLLDADPLDATPLTPWPADRRATALDAGPLDDAPPDAGPLDAAPLDAGLVTES
jgi:hypothetical protein